MNTSTDHVEQIAAELSEVQTELSRLAERVRRTQEMLRKAGPLKDWRLADRPDDRPHLLQPRAKKTKR